MRWPRAYSFILLSFALVARAQGCEWALLPEHARELNLTGQQLRSLRLEPRHQPLLQALARTLSILSWNDEELSHLAKLLSEHGSKEGEATPDPVTSFLAEAPEFHDEATRENLQILQQAEVARLLTPDALALLALLTRKLPKSYPVEEYYSDPGSPQDPLGLPPTLLRTRAILSMPRYRQALLVILSNRETARVQDYIYGSLAPSVGHDGRVANISLEQVIAKVRSGKTSRDAVRYLRDFILGFAYRAFASAGVRVWVSEKRAGDIFNRRSTLEALETYAATSLRVESSLGDISDIIDYFIFSTPLPLAPATLRREILDQAKTLLLPLKEELKRSAAKAGPAPPRPPGPPPELREKDFFPPGPAPSLRAKREKDRQLNK